MGSVKFLPGPSANKGIPLMSRLINSTLYYIDYGFILVGKNGYRLVALNRDRVLYDKYYPTIKGARIAFKRKFQEKASMNGMTPDWSHQYYPDQNWLEPKIGLLENS